MSASRPVLSVAIALGGASCGARGPAARMPGGSAASAVVIVDCPVPEADVVIDGIDTGPALRAASGIRVAPGIHRVEVHDDRYYDFYAEVAVAAGRTAHVTVTLEKALDPP